MKKCTCNGEQELQTVNHDGTEKEPGGHYFIQDFVLHLVTPSGQVLDRIKLNHCPHCGAAREPELEAIDEIAIEATRPMMGGGRWA